MGVFAIISLPYVKYIAPVIEGWTKTIMLLQIPSYAFFRTHRKISIASRRLRCCSWGLGISWGEELYFRGYLMKKSAFLGEANRTVNSVLFGLYHVWQVQQTWPMIGLILMFGVLMKLRKDLWAMVVFHLFVNMWMAYGTY